MPQGLTPEQSEEFCGQWTLAYPADRDGIHIEQFMCHVFSFRRYPSLSRAAAVHRDYDRLQALNVKGMRKRRETELAKQRGWA